MVCDNDDGTPSIVPWDGTRGLAAHCRYPMPTSTHVLLQHVVQHTRHPPAPTTPSSDASSSVTTALSTAVSRGPVVLPGPHELAGAVHAVPAHDRWFEHHWFWLRFRDEELEKRYTWWHSRQCVVVRVGMCREWESPLESRRVRTLYVHHVVNRRIV